MELCCSSGVYNRAAEIFADTNALPGTDIVRFGENISMIHDRRILEHISVLEQYDQSLKIFRQYYTYEQINDSLRETVQMIPESAFREAMANALMHRAWDVNANVNLAMHPDRIVITSPGGLPRGVSKADFTAGGLSVLRNRITGNIFFRLHLAERFGTGIRRIIENYRHSQIRPEFVATENAVRITLPLLRSEAGKTQGRTLAVPQNCDRQALSPDMDRMLSILRDGKRSRSAVSADTGFSKTKTQNLLNTLERKGIIRREGSGRSTVYSAIR